MTRTRVALACGARLVALAPAAPDPPAPLSSLPSYMSVLVDWGVRPEWSRDGRKLLFMERGLGDAYRVDVKTREVKPLTTHFYNPGFDRVLALANGDYLLTGTRDFDAKDPWSGRHSRFEMFVLDRSLTKPPVSLGAWFDEGPAVSRTRMHIAWTPPGQREMYEADLVYADGVPTLASERLVLSYADRPQTERLETQDFRPPDETGAALQLLQRHGRGAVLLLRRVRDRPRHGPHPQLHEHPRGLRRAGAGLPDGRSHDGRERSPRREQEVEDRHLPPRARRLATGPSA